MQYLHCTRELKQRPILKYVRQHCFAKGCGEVAIGIRADEAKRVPGMRVQDEFDTVYPLVEMGVDNVEVNAFWDCQPFTLGLEEHQGNCRWCFKKSFPKHALLAEESPEIYDFPRRMEQRYGEGRVFFRGLRNTDQLIKYVAVLNGRRPAADPDENSGCTESCEAFAGEL